MAKVTLEIQMLGENFLAFAKVYCKRTLPSSVLRRLSEAMRAARIADDVSPDDSYSLNTAAQELSTLADKWSAKENDAFETDQYPIDYRCSNEQ